jgi:hypothetical protein
MTIMEETFFATGLPEWKEFEQAVTRFISAAGPEAKVTYNAIIPDEHTGKPRQRDVWIEWRLFGHYPCKALASCKYLGRKLHQQDIDHFNGEFQSSGAQVGIVYSKEGYNDNAIDKSRKLGFHCCRLYRDQPPEIPTHLISSIYLFQPCCMMLMTGEAGDRPLTLWKDALALPHFDYTVLVSLAAKYDEFQKMANHKDTWRKAKEGEEWFVQVTDDRGPLFVGIRTFYKVWKAKADYMLLEGSYNFSSEDFQGQQKAPVVDMHSFNPDPCWEPITELPDEFPVNSAAIIMSGSSVKSLNLAGERVLPPPQKVDVRIEPTV